MRRKLFTLAAGVCVGATLALCFCCGCANSTPAADRPTHVDYPTAAELGRCPFGHSRLRDVPITYGFPSRPEELQRQEQNLEVWDGGCVISERSPRYRVVCADCRYSYDPHERVWEKTADDREAFVRPLPHLVAAVPAPAGAHARYFQEVRPDGTAVLDRVSYYAEGATLDLASRINAYVQQEAPMRLEGRVSQYPAGTALTVRGTREDGRVVSWGIEYRADLGKVSVDLVVAQPEFEPAWSREVR